MTNKIIYRLNDGLLVEAPKNMPKQDVLTRYYICKFLNPNRPKSWLEKNNNNKIRIK